MCVQAVLEYQGQLRHWQKACEEVGREKKRRSLTVSDMDSEVSRLKKVYTMTEEGTMGGVQGKCYSVVKWKYE